MKKKVLSLALVFIMVLFLTPITSLAASTYSDINDHWAQSAILKWSDLGIVKGSDGKFRPDDPMTRGELAVVIDRVMKYQKVATSSFSDLGQAFYTDAVLKANAAGIILGAGDLVHPTDRITREEAAVILARALGVAESSMPTVNFTDNALISSWAVADVNGMATKGFVHGYDNNFNPKATISRAEIVTILSNAIAIICSEPKEYTGSVNGTVVVNTSGATLNNMTINGDLIISEGVGNGDLTLHNVIVTGNMIIRGGGPNSIHITGNSHISNILIQKLDDGSIRIVAADGAVIDSVVVDDGTDDIILSGSFVNVTIAADVKVSIDGANIQSLNITAAHSSVTIDSKSTIKTLSFSETAVGSAIENNGTITNANVNANSVIISGSVPTTVNVGSNVTLGPTDSSGKPVTGQSSGGGGVIGGGGTPGGGSPGGGGVTLVNAVAPVITKDLTDVTTSVGAAITLDAAATVTDGGTVSYAWYSNTSAATAGGTALNKTTATYQPDVSAAGTYYYYCVVTNTNNAATGTKTATTTSAAATVTVAANTPVNAVAPKITHDLTDVTTSVGTAITLDATATVTDGGTVSYAWYSNTSATTAGGTPLNKTTATYQPSVSPAGMYYYYCVVTNTNNAATGTKTATTTSAVAKVTVTVNTPVNAVSPVITHDLTDVTTSVGTAITLDATATVTDGGTVSYAWYSNTSDATTGGTALTTETAATYQPNVSAAGTYYYYCVVTNTNNAATGTKTATTTSAAATVTVTVSTPVNAAAPVITHDLTDVTTSVGTAITLDATATVTDGGTVSYAWYSNTSDATTGGTALTTETAATYQPNVSAAGTYYYYCVVTNTNNAATGIKTATTTSAIAKVTVTANTPTAPFLDGYPQAVNIGSNSVDILVKADKAVTVYYVTYPIDLRFPDPNADQVIAGTDGANHHTLAVRSGHSGLIPFSDDAATLSLTNLYGFRVYHVFIVAVDQSGSKSAVICLPVTTLADRTSPVFKTGYPLEVLTGSNSEDILVQCYEVSSVVQYHWVAYVSDPSRAEPESGDVVNATGGDGLVYHQTGWSSAILDKTLHIANLSASTTYDVFIVAIDSELNKSEVAKITVTTRAVGDSAGRQLFVSQFQSLHFTYIGARDMYQYDCYLDGSPTSTSLLLPLSLKQVIAEGTWGLYNIALDSTGTIVTGLNASSAVCSGTGYTADSSGITANTAGTSSTYTCAASCLVYYVDNGTYSAKVLTPSELTFDTNDLISVWSSGLAPTEAIAIVITKVE